jgi:DNA-binding LytR/AlgR family response regulator
MTLKVLIVDNERQERTSLVELCEQRDDVQIVGEVESGVAALRAADELCPDVMLADVELPDMSAFDLPSAFQVPLWPHNKPRFLVGERQHRLYPLEVEKIDYIEARGNYVTIRSGTCDYIRRDSMKRLAAYLADWGFMRIERSLLLNVRAVAYAQVADHGTFAFTLSTGACIQSSTSYREAILDVIPLAPLSRRKERSSSKRSGER